MFVCVAKISQVQPSAPCLDGMAGYASSMWLITSGICPASGLVREHVGGYKLSDEWINNIHVINSSDMHLGVAP